VGYGFKICAVIFPAGPKFKNLPIDGYELPLNPGTLVKLIKLMIEDFFVINNDRESAFECTLW
jgi:hypothetical protein